MTPTFPSTNRSLPILLLRARERVMGPIRAMLSDAGVTEQQWRVLRVLDEFGPLEATRISEAACLLLPSLTRILQKLEAKGLVRRHRDADDKRKQIIEITDSGRHLIVANRDTSAAILQGVRDDMGNDDYERLIELLNRLDGESTREA